jgi:hypothetical protein
MKGPYKMITVGTDTEFFLTCDGLYVSAIRYIKGGKYNPVALPSGGGATYDNVAMEFATPVSRNENEFIEAIRATMKESISLLPSDISIDTSASTNFPKSELTHEEARRFGCDPDFDAWRLMQNEVPSGAAESTFRSAGGHLHIGYVEGSGNDFLLDPYGKVEMVKGLDVVIGLAFIILDHSPASIARRQLYGKAGCHRPTDYGVEYRSLSNFWTFSPKLVSLVFKLALETTNLIREGKLTKVIEDITEQTIVNTINKGNATKALKLWTTHVAPLLSKESVELFNNCSSMTDINLYQEWGF